MDWMPLPEIIGTDKMAACLRRQILDLEKFRADTVSPAPPRGRFYVGEEAVNEALRRELILRIDIARYLSGRGTPPDEQDVTIAQVRKMLDDREGHRG